MQRTLLLGTLLLLAYPLDAQTPRANPDSTCATAPCESDSADQSEGMAGDAHLVGASERVIDREELESLDPMVLADLLRGRVVGAYSLDAGARNDLYRTVRIRGPIGFPGCPTCSPKVLLDGVELSPEAISSVDASRLEEVRIVRGPHAGMLYGANSASGVILLTSRKGLDEPGTRTSAAIAASTLSSPYTTDTGLGRRVTGGVAGQTELGMSYDAGLGWFTSPTHVPEYEASGRIATFGFAGPVGRLGVRGSARYAERDFTRPGWAVAYYGLYSDGLLPAWGDHIDDNDYGDYRHFTFALNLDYQHSARWSSKLTIGRDQFDNDLRSIPDFESGDSMVNLETNRYEIPSVRLTSAAGIGLSFGEAMFRVGADYSAKRIQKYESYHRETGRARVTNWRGQILDEQARTGGAFGGLTLDLDRGVVLSAGTRADYHSLFGEDYGAWTWSPRVAIESRTEVAGGWALTPRVAWGVGFSAPRLEMLTGTEQVAPNPAIGPQRTSGWEAGLDVVEPSGRFSSALTLFRQVTTDGIGRAASFPGEDVVLFMNFFGTIVSSGLEWEGSWRSESTRLRANAFLVDNEVRNPRDAAEVRIEEDTAPAEGGWLELEQTLLRGGAWSVMAGGRLRYLGKRWGYDARGEYEAIAEGGEVASDHRWFDPILRTDALVALRHGPDREIRMEIENLTNDLTPEIPEIVIPGRRISLSLRVSL